MISRVGDVSREWLARPGVRECYGAWSPDRENGAKIWRRKCADQLGFIICSRRRTVSYGLPAASPPATVILEAVTHVPLLTVAFVKRTPLLNCRMWNE